MAAVYIVETGVKVRNLSVSTDQTQLAVANSILTSFESFIGCLIYSALIECCEVVQE